MNSDANAEKLDRVIAEYLGRLESGAGPDRELLLDQHPDLADDLRSFFANHDQMRVVTRAEADEATLRGEQEDSCGPATAPHETNTAEDVTLPPAGQETPSRIADRQSPIGTKVRYFSDYELLEEIARGGMGVVYKSRQLSLNRIVALKMILAGQLASDEDVRRFRAEAEAAANLDHPGIVPIFEVGEHKGQHYFSMGFVEGESLADRLHDGPLEPREAAGLTKQIAEAVAFAHSRGVIHRDLKPANVLLEASDQRSAVSDDLHGTETETNANSQRPPTPKITDFGLAKRVEKGSDLTATGQILGTPSYMPPEQAAGKIDQVKETADVYSMGAILYSCLTGRPPFQAHSPLDTLMQVLEQDPAEPRELNPTIPRDVETICLKCLEKEPAKRYNSAQELVADLSRFLRDEPIHARPIGIGERGWRWIRKQGRSVAIMAGAIAATAVLALLVLATWYSFQQWRLGYVTIGTDQPGLVADILHLRGEVAAPARTLPTTQRIKLSAGDYQLRVSGEGHINQTFMANVTRGEDVELQLNLEDQLLWPSQEIERSFAMVQFGRRAEVIHLTEFGLARINPASRKELWRVNLKGAAEETADATPDGLAVAWPWYIANSRESGRGQFDQRPC